MEGQPPRFPVSADAVVETADIDAHAIARRVPQAEVQTPARIGVAFQLLVPDRPPVS